jgi:HTH-type transcriptional regulator / antitoxin HigA
MAMNIDRPLRTEAEYDEAIAEVRRLWGAKVDTPQGNRLELLLVLVRAYEDERFQIDPPDPIEAIIERMNDRDMSRADLEALLGVRSGRVSEILNRRRPLSIDMIRKLAPGLGLSEHCLVQAYELTRQYA